MMRERSSKKDFLKNAKNKNFNIFFIGLDILQYPIFPVHWLSYLEKTEKFFFLLESSIVSEQLGQYTLLGFDPIISMTYNDGIFKLQKNNEEEENFSCKDPFPLIKKHFGSFKAFYSDPEENPEFFFAGSFGYMGYDSIRSKEKLPFSVKDDLKLPDVFLMIPKFFFVFDEKKEMTHFFSTLHLGALRSEDFLIQTYHHHFNQLKKKATDFLSQKNQEKTIFSVDPNKTISERECQQFAQTTKKEYQNNVKIAKQYLVNGDIFQVVLSQRFDLPIRSHPINIYQVLRKLNPSPYMFYLKCGTFVLSGSSPEKMISLKKKKIFTKPIAGTCSRGKNSEEDSLLEKQLLMNEKECAEHVMLVDLGRNDVGKISQIGSVSVSKFMHVEKYSHVIHIVSEIEGMLLKNKNPFDAVSTVLPAGTLSGAPKIRAMEIIDELETLKRGPYGGLLGYFSFNGDMDSCILIRSMICKDNKVFIQSGAGIVSDSDPENEYQECLKKAMAVIRAVKIAESSDPS